MFGLIYLHAKRIAKKQISGQNNIDHKKKTDFATQQHKMQKTPQIIRIISAGQRYQPIYMISIILPSCSKLIITWLMFCACNQGFILWPHLSCIAGCRHALAYGALPSQPLPLSMIQCKCSVIHNMFNSEDINKKKLQSYGKFRTPLTP